MQAICQVGQRKMTVFKIAWKGCFTFMLFYKIFYWAEAFFDPIAMTREKKGKYYGDLFSNKPHS